LDIFPKELKQKVWRPKDPTLCFEFSTAIIPLSYNVPSKVRKTFSLTASLKRPKFGALSK
jgi:hypothetical protein